ncbi:hypothetical protein FGM00_11895 [Aggregatimonas sangjinii]|uniref:Uncharacterized protein n=1 Tax=Aggregatimonas sangjinii TaxID=2583587 RepID=A0A5B7SQ10_9FLAO|nr:hypothetical protein [Aggregatimonas sangjinii]QCX00775.1 hypothetical protein FGM00_11895 [Aggregatimonas sangjinii]
MKSKKLEDIIKKYLAAESTLAEERTLFEHEENTPELEKWSTYVKHNKEVAPAHLRSTIAAAIQTRKRRKQRIFIGISGVAATIAIIMAVLMYPTKTTMGYEEKQALLNEAFTMFPEEQQIAGNKNIVYEDELVIVYTSNE